MSSPVAAIVLTFNEEKNIEACLQSLLPLQCPVYVVDSGSNDATVSLASRSGASVMTHEFTTHSEQWQWALRNVPLDADWILALDADQSLTADLASNVVRFTREAPAGVDGAYLCRRQVFMGRWIRHGGYYPKYLLKLFRRDKVRVDHADRVDHHFIVAGRTVKLAGDLVEANANENDINTWAAKHLRYARLQAEEELTRDARRAASFGPDGIAAAQKAAFRRLPLFVRPFLLFFYRYILRAGFLDGRQGLIFHFLQSCWYRFLVDVHIDTLRRATRAESVREDVNASAS